MKSSTKIGFVIAMLLAMNTGKAQSPIPVSLDLGIGAGVTLPSGNLGDADNTGWHAGAKARLHGPMPFNITAMGVYHRLPHKYDSEFDVETMLGAGLEFPLPTPVIKPYFGVDALVNVISATNPNASSLTREGLGLGGGIEFSIPMLGSFDVSVKYQMLNLLGKETNEETISQVSATASLMFSIL